ncbi:MAG: HEAT repeat domain-containing protein [Chloracidobacterium sp.]|nr:HEAT repeat domain-containing protein [Chloracidobacterium sp.]
MGIDRATINAASSVITISRSTKSIRPASCAVRYRLFIILLFIIIPYPIYSQSIDQLSDQIATGSSEQKRNGLAQLRNIQSAPASRVAAQALKDPDELVRSTAIGAVIYLPISEATTMIVPLLSDKAEFVRREAAYALGELSSVDAVDPLSLLVRKDRAPIVRAAAAAALGRIGSESGLETLMAVMQRRPSPKDAFLRRAAARSLGQIAERSRFGNVLDNLTTNTPADFLPEKYKQIVATPDTPKASPIYRGVLDILLKASANGKETDDTRREIAFALGSIGDAAAIPFLRSNIGSTDIYLGEICREALLKIAPQK